MSALRNRPGQRRRKSPIPLILVVGGALLVVLLAIVISRCASGEPAVPALAAEPSVVPTEVPSPTATPAPTPTPTVDPYLIVRPMPEELGYLPIFEEANVNAKQICITVDDCFQAGNLDTILDDCAIYGAKITIFPIGRNTMRGQHREPLRRAYAMGMEFENHSYSHSAFYKMSDAKMAEEITNANRAISFVLGVNYQMHFMRTRGGDNRRDLRTHRYIEKLGYYGMAHWSFNGSKSTPAKLAANLEPGQIYLFHTTDTDVENIRALMIAAVENGYEMLTLNEMFGFPENEEGPLPTALTELPVPQPDPYVYEYKTLKRGDYLWDVNLLQRRLIELGWLQGNPDGVYGQGTFMAIGYFQLAAGLKASGIASPETQEALFSEDAPRAGEGDAAEIGVTEPDSEAEHDAYAEESDSAGAVPGASSETSAPTSEAPPAPTGEARDYRTVPEIDMTIFD